MSQDTSESIELQGELEGHKDWVTCLATAADNPNMLLSGSRDKSVIVWDLKREKQKQSDPEVPSMSVTGKMRRRLTGHNHFIQDIDISSDSQYCLSASWDKSLRLWNLKTGKTSRRFQGHTKDALSVAFSANNRQIVSGSMDKTIRVWNVVGESKKVIGLNSQDNDFDAKTSHTDWVTSVRFSPTPDQFMVVSAGRDNVVKVWETEKFVLKHNLRGHKSYINTVTVAPDGSLCASGGKDGTAMLWDLNEGKNLSSLDAGGEIHALTFSPKRYWLCGAVGELIKIWDLETKVLVGTLPSKDDKSEEKKKKKKGMPTLCTCLAWSHDGNTLFAGYTDHKVRVWSLISEIPE